MRLRPDESRIPHFLTLTGTPFCIITVIAQLSGTVQLMYVQITRAGFYNS